MKSPRRTIVTAGLAALLSSGPAFAASFTRSGSDRITSAALPDIGTVTPGYDTTYGNVTALDGSSYSLSCAHDAYSGRQLTQTLVQTGDSGVKTTLSTVSNSYDALGRRINRTVDAGQVSPATASTDYWYGPMPLKPLSVERQDGTGNGTAKKGRVIYLGDEVLAVESGQDSMQATYPIADHLGSTRAVLDGDADTLYSLGYGDWGQTTIDGQASAVDVSDLATLFRFQGIEQDIFPLTTLGIDSTDALAWLDGIGQYHYHGREYAAGLASFLAMDPAGASVSPYSAFAGSPANYVDPDGMAPRKPRKESRPPLSHDSLEGLVAYLRKLGIEKLLMGEVHAQGDYSQIHNDEIISRLLEGATFGGMPLKFWNEVIGVKDQTFETYKLLPRLDQDQRKQLVKFFLTTTWQLGHAPGYQEKNLVHLERSMSSLLSPDTQLEVLAYDRSTRTDLTDFIKHKGFAIARTGIYHALAISTPESIGYWTGFPWNVEDGMLKEAVQELPGTAYRHSPFSIYEQLWSGWWRLQDAALDQNTTSKAALILPGTVYLASFLQNRTKIQDYLVEASTVFEFPVTVESSGDMRHAAGYNVTIAVDRAFREPIWQYIRNMTSPHAVNFNCTGLPGCPEPAREKAKDEL